MEGTFTLMNSLFYLLLFLVLANVLYLLFLNSKISGSLWIALNSIFLSVGSMILLFNTGYLTDELVLSGSSVPFLTTAAIVFLAFVSLLVALPKTNKKSDG